MIDPFFNLHKITRASNGSFIIIFIIIFMLNRNCHFLIRQRSVASAFCPNLNGLGFSPILGRGLKRRVLTEAHHSHGLRWNTQSCLGLLWATLKGNWKFWVKWSRALRSTEVVSFWAKYSWAIVVVWVKGGTESKSFATHFVRQNHNLFEAKNYFENCKSYLHHFK